MARPDWCPAEVWERAAAVFEANSHEPVGAYGLLCIASRAILAERERCKAVANERVAQLLAAYELPADTDTKAGYAGQVIEALLIEQRIGLGHVAKQSIQIEGLHKLAENTGFR